MTLKFNTQQEIADFIRDNAHDVIKMNELAAYYQSLNSSKNDAGLASSVNETVHPAHSENVQVTDEPGNVNDSSAVENAQLNHSLESFEQKNQSTTSEPSKSGEVAPSVKKNTGVQTKKDENPKSPLIFKREYYSLKDVADCFGIGVSSMHKLRKDGHIIGFLLGGKWLFTREQIEAFEDRLISGQISN